VSEGKAGGAAKRAVVLLSGGLDSATVLAIAKSRGYTSYALTVRYGQRHASEVEAARRVAKSLGVAAHRVIDLDLKGFGGSALVGDGDVPLDRSDDEIGEGGIPVTYVPARNTVFLSLALAWAEALGGADIFIGVNALDYSGYPDCRPEFIEAFRTLARLATKIGVTGEYAVDVQAPLVAMTKAEIIRTAATLGVDLGQTHSCYQPDDAGRACGRCDSCRLRKKGFADAGVPDPTTYAPGAG
jgi:7-cyano-7-deazaguanine synthase